VSGIRLSLEEMRSGRRGMLLGLQNSWPAYSAARRRLDEQIAAVESLTGDNPLQQANVRELRGEAHVLDATFRGTMPSLDRRFLLEEQVRADAGKRLTAIAERMLGEERRLLDEREAAQRASLQTFYLVLSGAGLLLLFVGSASIFVIMRYTRDLSGARDELEGLNTNLEGAVKVRTKDLQRANEEIQRFAYIVSHDLRSPLVNVMGFTSELEAAIKPLARLIEDADARDSTIVSDEARLAVHEDVPEALGFIRASTQKMDRLINAILRLSREGRRNITPSVVEITQLANTIADGIRHLIVDRGATVEVQADMPTVKTDRLALEQILSNLIENALKYLKPDRPGEIHVTARRELGRVLIAIADNGRGIDPRDHERIFDLFRRSGAQDQPGEGIGLAHVRTLAYRLGGTISVASELGAGAIFTIDLPQDYVGETEREA
jgi:signal transduction histidine kinase